MKPTEIKKTKVEKVVQPVIQPNVLQGVADGIKRIIHESVNRRIPYRKSQIVDCIHTSHKGAEVIFEPIGYDCKITILHDGNKISFNVPANLILDIA